MRHLLLRLATALTLLVVIAGCTPLDVLNAAVSNSGYLATEGIRYQAGPRGRLDVYRPRGSGPFPVVVWIYGGGWDSGDRAGYAFVGASLARRGFVTVIPDYTLTPAGRYPDFLRDNAAAVAWTVEHVAEYGGDADRLALMGHSAGAYNAAMIAYDGRWLRDLGADPAVVDAFVGLSGPYEIFPYTSPITRRVFGHVQSASVEPLSHVGKGDPPALLIHGGEDDTVSPRQPDRMAAALSDAGVPVDVVELPGAGHVGPLLGLSPPLQDDAVMDPVIAFLQRHIGPTARH